MNELFSQLDVLQGDTIYDMVERSDVDAVQAHLDVGSSSSSGNLKVFDIPLNIFINT